MDYILFAVLALFASIGNTIFNRLSADNTSTILSAVIKSFLITIASFLIVLIFGHANVLYALTGQQWLWLGILGAITCVDWIFYFLALKRAHLEAFAPFEASFILLISNLLFSFFMFNTVTRDGGTLNVIFYYLGLAFLLGSSLFAVFNKKINPKAKIAWVIYSMVSATALAFTLVVVKAKLSDVPSDVVAVHQMSVVFVTSLFMMFISKTYKEIKNVKPKSLALFFIAAAFNALLMVFRYKALSFANSIPSIVNVIISLDFVFVSIATVLFFKANNKKQLVILILLVLVGMVLNVLSGLLI